MKLTNGMELPEKGSLDWNIPLNNNFSLLDNAIGKIDNKLGKTEKAASAEIAIKDAQGRVIDETYALNSDLTTHTSNAGIHVTASDKNKWNNKQDALSAQQISNIANVTNKANDTDVVHKSGDETIGGVKTFNKNIRIQGSNRGDEFSTNARTVLELRSNRDTADKSGIYISKFRQNRSQGGMTGTDSVILSIDTLEDSVRSNSIFRFIFSGWEDNVPTKVYFEPTNSSNIQASIGSSTNKWKDVNTNAINGINPGALSLPSTSYVNIDTTDWVLDGVTVNQLPTSSGSYAYLSLMTEGDNDGFIEISWGGYPNGHAYINSKSVKGYCGIFVPVFNLNKYESIYIKANRIRYARWYYCQGNV